MSNKATKKYVDLLTQTKEESNKTLAPQRAAAQKAALGLKIGELELKIASAEAAVSQLTSVYPIDWDAVLVATDDLDLDKRALETLKALDSQLF